MERDGLISIRNFSEEDQLLLKAWAIRVLSQGTMFFDFYTDHVERQDLKGSREGLAAGRRLLQ